MPSRLPLALTLICLPLVASAAPRRIVVDVGELASDARAALTDLARHSAVELVSPMPSELPQRDAILSGARRAYGNMAFARAVTELAAQEGKLVDGARPSPDRSTRLAELELFLGACLFLDHDARGAEERFVLARTLAPSLALDPIFPPEVGRAFAAAKAGAALPVELALSPNDARLWVDGVAASGELRLPVGLHYVVLERADRRPAARVLRVSRAAARIELSAATPATRDEALLALRAPGATPAEALAVSRLLDATLWRMSTKGVTLDAQRSAAHDLVKPSTSAQLAIADHGAIERAICSADPCDAAEHGKPTKPVWRRTWFWGVVGAGAAVVLGGVIAGAVVGTRPRDYDVVVR